MNRQRQRKLDARARRQESLHGITAKDTGVKVPQPKNLVKNEVVKVKEVKIVKSPVITEVVKRGRGRPPKAMTEKIASEKSTRKIAPGSKKNLSIKVKEKK